MKEIKNRRLHFLEFYQELLSVIDANGDLTDVLIFDCIVYNIPQNYRILVYGKVTTFLGLRLYETDGTFFGFRCKNVTVEGCKFIGKDAV